MLEALLDRHTSFLESYHFDKQVFLSLQTAVKAGRLGLEQNRLPSWPEVVPEGQYLRLEHFRTDETATALFKAGEEALRRGEVACLILNGGMATRFGGAVKGLCEVYDGKTFLQLKLEGIARVAAEYGRPIPVVLMNSFQTDGATSRYLEDHHRFGFSSDELLSFNQSISLRLDQYGEVFLDERSQPSFYTPGHGDFQGRLVASGLHARLIERGIKLLCFSNIDNLLARIDPLVLGIHLTHGGAYTCEVVANTAGDVGGSPILLNGRLQVIEGLRFPKDYPTQRIRYLSTNTFVFDLTSLSIIHPLRHYLAMKNVSGRTALQFEKITNELTVPLNGACLVVEREGAHGRFIPIKQREDLIDKAALLRSFLN
ncbi:MAG: hypothetical protein A2284_03965 [Deltaproteobacteria bacterium RIFOXYA12_FULL_61_11]|nr:MAG: hypothetical protein A2284_03965 [Deltaproteobacteria bacterium RIFOXYA12_FULL_61_11]